ADTGAVLPQLGSVALQSGEWAGDNIARRLAGQPTTPFSYHDKGTMATIGRGAAVVQMPGGRTMKGRTASRAWGAVHLALLGTGEHVDNAVFERFAKRLSYVSGDFDDPATYERVAEAIDGAQLPVFYLEIPPFLFARVVRGLTEANLSANARMVIEKPFGHDL